MTIATTQDGDSLFCPVRFDIFCRNYTPYLQPGQPGYYRNTTVGRWVPQNYTLWYQTVSKCAEADQGVNLGVFNSPAECGVAAQAQHERDGDCPMFEGKYGDVLGGGADPTQSCTCCPTGEAVQVSEDEGNIAWYVYLTPGQAYLNLPEVEIVRDP